MNREPYSNDNLASSGAAEPWSAARSQQYLIGRGLRELYNNVVREPVPAHLLRLVDQISNGRKSG